MSTWRVRIQPKSASGKRTKIPVFVVPPKMLVLLVFGGASFLLVIRILWVFYEIHFHRTNGCQRRPPAQEPPLRTLVVLGSGGHTTEMLTMTQTLVNDDKLYHPVSYCKASTDSTSSDRLQTYQRNGTLYEIPRSREVGQSFSSSIPTTLWALAMSFQLVYRLRPDVILCNGPGTCVPICLAGIFYRVVCFQNITIVFVESFCRVRSLSLTGKLLYGIADVFLVHWKSLQAQYPKTTLTSAIVQHS